MSSSSKIRKITVCAVLVAAAIVLSAVERTIPLSLVVPLPGIKLGLANIVTMFALFYLGFPAAFAILLCRIGIMFLITGNATSFFLSLSGGVLSILAMRFSLLGFGRRLSILGVSVAGAAAHNIGQLLACSLILKSVFALSYTPVLMLSSVATGAITAICAFYLFRAVDSSHALPVTSLYR